MSTAPAAVMPSLPSRFHSLKDARINYVVMSGHRELPTSVPGKDDVLILTTHEHLPILVNLLCLQKGRGVGRYDLPYNAAGDVKGIYVVEKGRGVWPDRFEGTLLGHSVVKNEVRVPDPSYHALAMLYYKVYHEDWLRQEPSNRQLICDYLDAHVGIMTAAEYNWIKNFSR